MSPPPGWVLVVDDDATDRLVLFRLLERAGHHATVTDSGAAALDLLRGEPFDLVLLDLVMPDPDGYAVLRAIKEDPCLRNVPVIMISGVEELEATVRCIELGAHDYLDKPVDPVLLRARVDTVLEKKHLQEREAEYHDVIGHLAEAATMARTDPFPAERLDPVVRRPDPLGHLARAVRQMGSQIEQLRSKIDSVNAATLSE